MIILEIEIKTIKKNKEILLDHRIKRTQHSNRENRNFRSSTLKHQRQIIKVQFLNQTITDPTGEEKIETLELQPNYLHCESTDDKNETEITLVINKIRIEHEFK